MIAVTDDAAARHLEKERWSEPVASGAMAFFGR